MGYSGSYLTGKHPRLELRADLNASGTALVLVTPPPGGPILPHLNTQGVVTAGYVRFEAGLGAQGGGLGTTAVAVGATVDVYTTQVGTTVSAGVGLITYEVRLRIVAGCGTGRQYPGMSPVLKGYQAGTTTTQEWRLATLTVSENANDPVQVYRGGGAYSYVLDGWLACYYEFDDINSYGALVTIGGDPNADGGSAVFDPPSGYTLTKGLVTRPSGKAGVRGIIMGRAFDIAVPYNAGPGLPATLIHTELAAHVEANNGYTATASAKATLSDITGQTSVFEVMGGNQTATNGAGTASTVGGVSVSQYSAGPATTYATAAIDGYPSRSFRIRGKLLAPDGAAYPDANSLPVYVHDCPAYGAAAADLAMVPGTNGVFDSGLIRQQYQVQVISWDNDVTAAVLNTINTYNPVGLTLRPADLITLGENPYDTKVQLRGDYWNALYLTQAASLDIDTGGILTHGGGDWSGVWSALGPATVAAGGGDGANPAITITTPNTQDVPSPATPGAPVEMGVSRKFTKSDLLTSAPVWLCSYRYLKIRLRSTQADLWPFALRIGAKLWYAQTGTAGTWTDVVIDLCQEKARTDGQALPLAVARDGIRNYADGNRYSDGTADSALLTDQPEESPFFGVNQAASIDFIGLAPNESYEIAKLTLFRSESVSRLNCVAPWHPQWISDSRAHPSGYTLTWGRDWPAYSPWPGTSGGDFRRRILWGDVDGRLSMEASDARYTIAGGVTRSVPAIKDLVTEITAKDSNGRPFFPGWDAVDLAPSTHTTNDRAATLCSDAPACLLWGAGVLWARIDPVKNPTGCLGGVDIPLPAAGVTIPAQLLFDYVDWWPGAGDSFGWGVTGPANGATIELRAGKILRGQAVNLLVGDGATPDADNPAATATVRLKETTSRASGGQGTDADSYGRYETGAPYARMALPPTYASYLTGAAGNPRLYDAILNGAPMGATGTAAAPDGNPHTPQADGLTITNRQRRRVTFAAPGRPGVAIIADRLLGFLMRAWTTRSAVWFRRCEGMIPTASADWQSAVLVYASDTGTGATVGRPAVVQHVDSMLRLRWEIRTPPTSPGNPWSRSVWESTSTTDGDSWSTPQMIDAQGQYPVFGQGADELGLVLAAVIVPDPSGDGSSNIKGALISPGDPTPTTPFVFQVISGSSLVRMKVSVGAAGYSITKGSDKGGSWILSVLIAGEVALSEWQSTTDGATWTRLPATP